MKELYVLEFDPATELIQYLDWLNMEDCQFPFEQESPWVDDASFKVVISLEESQEDKLCDYFFCGPLTIVSESFRDVLQKYSSNLEFVPTAILCGEAEFRYFVLHVMDWLDAVDESNTESAGSKYGMMAGIVDLALRNDVVGAKSIFYLKRTFTPILIVSEDIARDASSLDLTGMEFTRVSEYREDTWVAS